MAKARPPIASATKEKILKLYAHHCAICEGIDPEVHHIDENPSNNDELNLIPLCASCHTYRVHSPNNQRKLKLFRHHGERLVFAPQFRPFLNRLEFLDDAQSADINTLTDKCNQLVRFIETQKNSTFYASEIKKLLSYPQSYEVVVARSRPEYIDVTDPRNAGPLWEPGDPMPQRRIVTPQYSQEEITRLGNIQQQRNKVYRDQVEKAKEKIYELIVVEMLPFQNWPDFDLPKAFRMGG